MILDDSVYLEIILEPIRVCAEYKPKFGQGRKTGMTLDQFQSLYQNDPFYSWFGLDNPLMYAAHKTAGGMTSIYRQIGIGCERLFRQILQDALDLSPVAVNWSYEVTGPTGKRRVLSLDARVPVAEISNSKAHSRFRHWIEVSAETLGVERNILHALSGVVFEIRQGYKSKDAKRQNADIANAAAAYAAGYLPCAVLFSSQIDTDILTRYRMERWLVLIGLVGHNDPFLSTYDFMREIVGYDLAAFFDRNKQTLYDEIERILRNLLSPRTP